LPHHVTQRGNYRQTTFSEESGYFAYLPLLREQSIHFGVSVQAYCLMPIHTPLILVPAKEDALPRMMQRQPADYARYVHLKTGWIDHLWKAQLVNNCWDWRWSSAGSLTPGRKSRATAVGEIRV
jgi:putative transposase